MSAKPFVRNNKMYFPLIKTSVSLLRIGESFLKAGSKTPYKVVDPNHKMGVMCQVEGRDDKFWFNHKYPVTQLMVIS